MFRAASAVLSAGAAASAAWSGFVTTNPKSSGGEADATMGMVYSTPMKTKSKKAKTSGKGWCLTAPATPETDHPAKNGPCRGNIGKGEGFGVVPALRPTRDLGGGWWECSVAARATIAEAPAVLR